MKKIFLALLGMTFLSATSVSAQSPDVRGERPERKILIAYYSWSGNTKTVAESIQKQIGGDLFEIQTVQTYPSDYDATVEQAGKEIKEGYRPELKVLPEDVSKYDFVFIASPNWWGTIAPAVSTFLEKVNLEGKKVVPIITHGRGGLQRTVADLTEQCKDCIMIQSWHGYGNQTEGLSAWLEGVGF